ncbi:HutD family protein [Rhodanobacter sp. C03]|uniref:HutD/Ves family protein n=1 Tax=Rhodanobacter sp. C03 TaxID=1945858 RepID=UPI00098619FF|nr:HutD family protein [Rhodanobacter sp. C03]OOG59498.1 histidine utilization protein HutD [Rhodanobacter sp. C03]
MIIRLSDCPPQPWKNGLGSTREIAIHPDGAGSADFLWRVSIAEVDSAAPFSSFPGIDRQIALLDGNGFTMTLDGDRVHALTTPFVPFAFAGEAGVTVALVGGATRDFNLMVRRAKARSNIRIWREAGAYRLDRNVVLLYCAKGQIDVGSEALQAGDSWINSMDNPSPISLHQDAMAFAIHVEPLIQRESASMARTLFCGTPSATIRS